MKIAFVSANRERLPDAVVPIGVLYVMASLPARHETLLWDLCFEADPLGYLADRLRAYRPDVVAIGMRNIQNSDYTDLNDTIGYYERVVSTVRSCSSATVVVGGGGFSVMPEGLMRQLKPDFGIAGEGESAFRELIDRIESRTSHFEGIGRLHHFRDGALVSNPPAAVFQQLDDVPVPDRRRADARYYTEHGIESIQTKRGCPLRCDYCTYPLIEGRSIRQRDPARVVDELFQALEQRPEINHFFVVDSVFNLPPSHAKAVCREMIKRRFDTPWTCYANPLGFDRELADLMVEASCAGAEIGSDSGCDDVLDHLKKGFHVDRIAQMHEDCAAAGLRDCHTFILGTRGETLDHVRRTLDFCRDLDPFAAILMIWTDDYEALEPERASARKVFRRAVIDLLREKEREFPRWIIPPLRTNFDPRLFRLLRRRGLTGPLWQHIQLAGSDARTRRLKRSLDSLPTGH